MVLIVHFGIKQNGRRFAEHLSISVYVATQACISQLRLLYQVRLRIFWEMFTLSIKFLLRSVEGCLYAAFISEETVWLFADNLQVAFNILFGLDPMFEMLFH